jgi:hypothetical protein
MSQPEQTIKRKSLRSLRSTLCALLGIHFEKRKPRPIERWLPVCPECGSERIRVYRSIRHDDHFEGAVATQYASCRECEQPLIVTVFVGEPD